MCGIIGYTGGRPAVPILLDGLARLEYRGYDSAGIAVLGPDGEIATVRSAGKLSALAGQLGRAAPTGAVGVGHTRWATHGSPTTENAHPHTDCSGHLCVVHNGIVENAHLLREELERQGHCFRSETDTEVVPHLMERYLAEGASLLDALLRAARLLRGANAIVAMSADQPGQLASVRMGNAGGIILGYGDHEMYVASDVLALLPYARRVTYLENGQAALLTPEGATVTDLHGSRLTPEVRAIPYDTYAAAKGGHRHFMQKEIAEQPEAVMGAIGGRVRFHPHGDVALDAELGSVAGELRNVQSVVLFGMGTSYHACLAARLMMERLAGVPATAENASEYRYQDILVDPTTLVVAITQSGETADTLGAMQEARDRGTRVLALCNVDGSQATRTADAALLLNAGPEIGVCATKTFTNSLTLLYLLALQLGTARGFLAREACAEAVRAVTRLPEAIGEALRAAQGPVLHLAERLYKAQSMLYLGRGVSLPVALEGALKMKEVAYIHAEGYPAGEMKHGPIALIDRDVPVVAAVPPGKLREKTLANIAEVRARGAEVIAVGMEGDGPLAGRVDQALLVPAVSELLYPVVASVPLQILAYAVAVRRGCDVDQPRNLAKSVTVE